jgi:transketolase
MAEIATALYTRHLKFDAADPTWPDRDRVVLSNGHGSMLLYALLYLSGYERIGIEQVSTFRDFGSRCEGHPEFDTASGIEVTTGPLGQGIANAFGMAVAEAYLNARYGDGVVDHRTYAFVGDGCLQEGIGQEMISLAGHLRLGKLILLWDDNRITDDGVTGLSISEDVAARFRVADWHVVEVDGHDLEAVSAAIAAAKADPRPSLVACRTVIAKGIARLQGQRGGHSAKLLPEDAATARAELGWSAPPFEIPADVLAAGATPAARPRRARRWQARVAALPPAQRAEFERIVAGELPEGWRDVLLDYKRGALERAPLPSGIFVSAEINDLLVDRMPERMVGCADLEAPTNHKRRLTAFTAQDRRGAYVHCGVREHVMGAMANGMAAHGGIVPMAVTYLAFSDYERPAMRMAALMGLPVKFVFSHDSIGIGRNGPTHQPVEILASLRAMPNMLVLRPADAVEAAECWEIAFEHRAGHRRSSSHARRCRTCAACTRAPTSPGAAPTYSSRQKADARSDAARHRLRGRARTEGSRRAAGGGTPTAVVSMPSWELFTAQDAGLSDRACSAPAPCRRRLRSRAALRLGPLARRARRLRRHDRLRRLRPAEVLYRTSASRPRRSSPSAPPARHSTRERPRMSIASSSSTAARSRRRSASARRRSRTS